MKFRDSIVQVLDDLNTDLNINPTPQARFHKLKIWNTALEGITDENIIKGFRNIIKTEIKYLPTAGAFRKFCIFRQTSNSSTEENSYMPAPPEISKKNAGNVLGKLLKINEKCMKSPDSTPKNKREMLIYEFYSGSRWSYQTEGEHSYKDFTDEIRRLYPIQSKGQHFGDVTYFRRKFGEVKMPGDNHRLCNTMVKCDKSDPDGRVYSRVVML